jgi:hypothetical protein
MTQAEAFNATLSHSSDATTLRGKLFSTFSVSGTPSLLLSLAPPNFGVRSAALSLIFSRYRIKYLKFKFMTSNGTAGSIGTVALGIQDDVSLTGDVPTTMAGIAELRSSATSFLNQTIPTEFEWSPVDKKLWYYTNGGADTRLSIAGSLYGGASVAVSESLPVEIDFCIVFEGATDVGGN